MSNTLVLQIKLNIFPMPKFRKRPVVIEAIQLSKANIHEVYCFVYGAPNVRLTKSSLDWWERYCDRVIKDGMDIHTLEDGNDGRAKHVASIGDWVIKGVKGEFYPCKPDIFEATYEQVEDDIHEHRDFGNETPKYVISYDPAPEEGGSSLSGAKIKKR